MNYSSSQKPVGSSEGKKMKKSDKLLLKIKEDGFNMSQLEEVVKAKGNQLVISIAGSGKTTSLIFKIMYDITTGEATKVVTVNDNDMRVLDRIWVCTFLKSGADELETKLSMWQRKFGMLDTASSMSFSTLHAEFKRALTGLGVSTNIIDSGVNSKNLKKIVDGLGLTVDGKPINGDTIRDLEGALTYTRNRLDDRRYQRKVYQDIEIGPAIIDSILLQWKQMRRAAGCVDFEDLQEILYEECCVKGNQEVIDFLKNRYNYIYIDEFQDTSQIQYELIKVYASGTKKTVVFGDDDQTIYSWRGSYNKIITENFVKDFNPVISTLNVNYRCPENILKGIKPSIEMNQNRFKKELKSYNSGGILRIGEYPNYLSMVESLSELITEDIKNNRSVSVLCRVNSDGLMPALIFDKMGKFQYTISGDGMTLDSYIGRSVVNIAKLFTERNTQAVKTVLGQLTWDKYNITNIMSVCKNNKVSFWEIPDEDIIYSCPAISNRLITWKKWRKDMGDIATLRLIYMTYRTEVYVKDTQYNTVCKNVIRSVEALLEVFKGDTVDDFLEELEEINERLKARKKKFGSKVRIATVHEYKGKEADSIYVWNDSVDIFPHKDCDQSDEEELEEERRVHYIACTRAKKINTVMCLKNKRGMFVDEMDLSGATRIYTGDSSMSLGGVMKSGAEQHAIDVLCDNNEFWEETQDDSGINFGEKLKSKESEQLENSSNLEEEIDLSNCKVYTADDEEPDCCQCIYITGGWDCVHDCGSRHGWNGYKRVEEV